MRMSMALFLVLVFPCLSWSGPPKTPDAIIRFIQANDDGTLTVNVSETTPVVETRVTEVPSSGTRLQYKRTSNGLELEEVPNSGTVSIEYNVHREVIVMRMVSIAQEKFRAYNMKGEAIDGAVLKQRFKTARPAIVSTFENSVVDPAYLSVLKDDAVIIVLNAKLTEPDESVPPVAPPAPTESSSDRTLPPSVRQALNATDGCITSKAIDSLIDLIQNVNEPPKLRSEAIKNCGKIVDTSKDKCESFSKALIKVVGEKEGDLELRKLAIETIALLATKTK